MIVKSYMIPEENIESFEKKFLSASHKIRKINPELEPTMTKSDNTVVLVRTIEIRPCDYRSEPIVKEAPYEARRVELKIPDDIVFAENGWLFGGTVEPSEVEGKTLISPSLQSSENETSLFFEEETDFSQEAYNDAELMLREMLSKSNGRLGNLK